jgi:hypothetical protein
MSLFRLGAGSYFGEYESIEGVEQRQTQVVCLSAHMRAYRVDCYVISGGDSNSSYFNVNV